MEEVKVQDRVTVFADGITTDNNTGSLVINARFCCNMIILKDAVHIAK